MLDIAGKYRNIQKLGWHGSYQDDVDFHKLTNFCSYQHDLASQMATITGNKTKF